MGPDTTSGNIVSEWNRKLGHPAGGEESVYRSLVSEDTTHYCEENRFSGSRPSYARPLLSQGSISDQRYQGQLSWTSVHSTGMGQGLP